MGQLILRKNNLSEVDSDVHGALQPGIYLYRFLNTEKMLQTGKLFIAN